MPIIDSNHFSAICSSLLRVSVDGDGGTVEEDNASFDAEVVIWERRDRCDSDGADLTLANEPMAVDGADVDDVADDEVDAVIAGSTIDLDQPLDFFCDITDGDANDAYGENAASPVV